MLKNVLIIASPDDTQLQSVIKNLTAFFGPNLRYDATGEDISLKELRTFIYNYKLNREGKVVECHNVNKDFLVDLTADEKFLKDLRCRLFITTNEDILLDNKKKPLPAEASILRLA